MQVLVTEKITKDKLLHRKFPYLIFVKGLCLRHSKVLIIDSLGNTSPTVTVYMISGLHSAVGEDNEGMMVC
jgi:hypothetical protein